jgi:STAS-like domain of unknown function (DUF4325)
MKPIKIATDFSETPLGRYPTDGDFNGARFREEFLFPALTTQAKVIVDIDDVEGYGSSFLDEAFGGLVRKGYFTAGALKDKLDIQYHRPEFRMYHDLVWKYIDEAKPE